MSDDIEATLNALGDKLNQNSDIARAMEEFFKDKIDNNLNLHDIDLRSRLVGRAIRGHSVINFLMSCIVDETKDSSSLADGLGVLSISLKRHVLSLEGKSRMEIIDLFKSNMDAKRLQGNNFNMMAPMPK